MWPADMNTNVAFVMMACLVSFRKRKINEMPNAYWMYRMEDHFNNK